MAAPDLDMQDDRERAARDRAHTACLFPFQPLSESPGEGRAWQMGASPDRRPTGAGQSAREDPGCIWPYLRARHGKTVAKGTAPR